MLGSSSWLTEPDVKRPVQKGKKDFLSILSCYRLAGYIFLPLSLYYQIDLHTNLLTYACRPQNVSSVPQVNLLVPETTLRWPYTNVGPSLLCHGLISHTLPQNTEASLSLFRTSTVSPAHRGLTHRTQRSHSQNTEVSLTEHRGLTHSIQRSPYVS